MIKNLQFKRTRRLLINTKKLQFSSTRVSLITVEELIKQRKKITAKLRELGEERQILKEDLENITEGVSAVSKIVTDKPLSEENKEVLKEYKENYPAFIDSDDEDGAPGLLGKFNKLRSYFNSELNVNRKSMDKLRKQRAEVVAQTETEIAQASSSKTNPISKSEGASSSINETVETSSSRTIAPSQLKRKTDYLSDSEESFSSKRSRNTPTNDFIDDLPELPYNPFDDLGFD